ncbi:MAG: SAM-dependent chlorinase/fluorinase [Bacteroidales bacterium]|nr:SAM-dependent chlorinase/fluorinase [Bacteroidales bacterium]
MPIITLTSDWYNSDYYIGAVKGRILRQCPDTTIVDISHNISSYSLLQAAYILQNCYKNFPDNTVHIIAVNSEQGKDHPHVVVQAESQYFISSDSGIYGLMFEKEPEKIVQLPSDNTPGTFPAFQIFADVACELTKGKPITDLGKPYEKLKKHVPMLPAIDDNVINGSVVYIDSYRNVISNISKELFDQIGKNRPAEILVQSNHYRITKINNQYNETPVGELLALFNAAGYLEVAINNGNAADLLNLNVGSVIRVKFRA